ncbi:di-heme oxidoredictase family protein [Devosia algicola]|uniref:Di-heme oxidoredictase family protein n=1 Tax=Devosia algicola TaxID=3026418 RepID=A0ABY7YKE1_9HYPH|nr:di-heme oxidoredictase family protein [Devosia algicola]WDR01702.1 di-heme oxidoredictase family protein [Devosia algicola]
MRTRPESRSLNDESVRLIEFYVSHLAIPTSDAVESARAITGRTIFGTIGCAACHVPSFVTSQRDDAAIFDGKQIWPYSDFLLHDMGADLADGVSVGAASASEWRTAPLWGIGLTEAVSGHSYFLHDGRARTVSEAILWHGGEAAAARSEFQDLSDEERQALLEFLATI